MSHTIQFSVHRNPLKDAEGNDTYQVRHENWYTVRKSEFLNHLRLHNAIKPEQMEMALTVLAAELMEHLANNRRVHLEGLGTFYLKVGFRQRFDEDGREQKPHFTDPADITGSDVCIETVGFTPDKAFLSLLEGQDCHFRNLTGHGRVGHSAHYDDEDFLERLNAFLDKHGYTTRRQLMLEFGLTDYMARKWLSRLCAQPEPLLHAEKIGTTLVYRR